jgi:hypothetical protein
MITYNLVNKDSNFWKKMTLIIYRKRFFIKYIYDFKIVVFILFFSL